MSNFGNAVFLLVISLAINQQVVLARTKALIIGISHYQDPAILDLQLPHRDAELFAGYLKNSSGLKLRAEDLQIYTNAHATAGQIYIALDRMFDDAHRTDTLILYYAGYGIITEATKQLPERVFYYDTPLQVNDAGSFDLFQTFVMMADQKKVIYGMYTVVFPIWFPQFKPDSGMMSACSIKNERVIPHTYYCNNMHGLFNEQSGIDQTKAKISLSSFLLEGMKGLADKNGDQKVKLKELTRFFNKALPQEGTAYGFLGVCCRSENQFISNTDQKYINRVRSNNDRVSTSIIEEAIIVDDPLVIRNLPDSLQKMLEDYVVQIELGRILSPPEENAWLLFNKLIHHDELAEVNGEIKRRLAAALQDEVQQGLNSYLNADSQELIQRTKGYDYYCKYVQYMQMTEELLGQRHYLIPIVKAKRLYFEGLVLRMQGQAEHNMKMIELAINKLKEALNIESEASFLLNEMGIDYKLQGLPEISKNYFIKAIEASPSWSIPYVNLAYLYLRENPTWSINLARQALRLQPENSMVYNLLGVIYMREGNYVLADRFFTEALRLNPQHQWILYNAVCLYALTGKNKLAMNYLEQSFESGFSDIHLLLSDPDLEKIRSTEEWKLLVKKYFPEAIKD